MYVSTAEKAKKLRDYYKSDLKLTRSDVSVTKAHEGCIHVNLKNAQLSTDVKDKIYTAAMKYENIQRDEYSGEILSGGNDFVFVYDTNGYTYRPSDM